MKLLLAALAVAATQQPQTPTFRSGVDLVQVHVVAVDASGKHVYGLKAEDFQLFDRGTLRPIATFQEIDGEAPGANIGPVLPATVHRDVATNQPIRNDRLVVVVVDDVHIYRGRTDQAKAIARDLIGKLGPDGSMAVLFTSGERGTGVTDNPPRLLAAVDTLKGRQSWRRPHQALDNQTPIAITPDEDLLSVMDKVNQSQLVNVQDFFDNMTQFKTLEDAAHMLATSSARRKAFVMVSEGISKDLAHLFDEPGPDCRGPCYHLVNLRNMMHAMHRGNVATYVVDPRGHVSPVQDLLRKSFPAPPGLLSTPAGGPEDTLDRYNPIRLAQSGLGFMAEASGGFAVTNTDDLAGGVSRIVEDLEHYYLLGFYPPDPQAQGYRQLEVKTARPGLTLRFRRGYAAGFAPPAVTSKSPLDALVSRPLPIAALPMRLHTIQMPSASKEASVFVALELAVPRTAMQEDDRRLRDEIKYGVYAVDMKSARVRQSSATVARFVLTPRADGVDPPSVVRYQVMSVVSLPPGTYQMRVATTSEKLTEAGTVFQTIDVADRRKEPFALSDLLVGYAYGPRVPTARDRTLKMMPGLTPLPFDPTLDRTFVAKDGLRLFFKVERHTGASLTAKINALTPDGRVVLTLDRSIPSGDQPSIDLRLPLAQLAAGSYQLQVKVTDGTRTVERALGFVITR